jgi:hypothetical protein
MMSGSIKGVRICPVVGLLTAILLVLPAAGLAAGRRTSRQFPTPRVLQAPGSGIPLSPASSGFSPSLSFFYSSDLEKAKDPKSPSGKDDPAAVPAPSLHRNTGRALFEIGSVMMYSQVRYWLNYAKFIEDWQFHFSWKDQKRRFFTFETWSLDSNAFSLNWTHAFAGVLYYNFARTNHLSWPQSFLYSLGGSLWWEYVAEWREVISLNDNIMTSAGGYAAGEAWFQLGKYFIGRNGFFNRLLSFIDPLMKLNHWLDKEQGKNLSLGPKPGWHSFRFFLGQRNMPASSGVGLQTDFIAGFHTQIIHLPDYGKPGKTGRMVMDTLASDLDVDFAFLHGRIEEANFSTRVVGLGYFKQDINADFRGYAYYFGLGSAFTLFKKKSVAFYDSSSIPVKQGFDLHLEEPRKFRDKLSVVHILGPAFDYTKFSPASRLRLVLDATLDFGLINSYALNKYSIGRDLTGVKTTLLYYGYYYGLGTTLSSGLTYKIHGLEFNGFLRYQAYGSVDGLDRFQNEVTDDFHLTDTRLTYRIGAALRLPGTPVELYGSYEGIDRRGVIKDIRHGSLEKRYTLFMSYKF